MILQELLVTIGVRYCSERNEDALMAVTFYQQLKWTDWVRL